MRVTHIALGWMLLLPWAHAAVHDAGTNEILERARQAHGTAALLSLDGALVVEGPASPWETDGWHTLSFTGHGPFRETIRGPLASERVCDGDRVWDRFQQAAPTELVLMDREVTVVMNWIRTGSWLREDAPLTIRLVERGADSLRLGVLLEGGVCEAQVELDAETHRVRRACFERAQEVMTIDYGDYRPYFGVQIPCRVDMREMAGLESDFRVNQVRLEPLDRAGFTPLERSVGDATFDGDRPAALTVETIATGHAIVPIELDDREIGWFIFDSGAGVSAITPEAASALGLEPIGVGPLAGLGPEATRTPLYQSRALRIGPMTIHGATLIEFDIHGAWNFLPKKIAGIIGWDVLSRCVCELDPVTGQIALHPSDHETGAPFGPLTIYGRLPHVRGRYEGGRSGLFALDTGAPRQPVFFNEPTVRRHEMLADRETRAGTVRGAGGVASFEVGEVDWFELHEHRFEPAPAIFGQDPTGSLADPCIDGSVGGQFLAPFRLVFDYPDGRLAFVPREDD